MHVGTTDYDNLMCHVNPKWAKAGSLSLGWLVGWHHGHLQLFHQMGPDPVPMTSWEVDVRMPDLEVEVIASRGWGKATMTHRRRHVIAPSSPWCDVTSHQREGKAVSATSQFSHNLFVSLNNTNTAKNLKLMQVEHTFSVSWHSNHREAYVTVLALRVRTVK